jgi:hypothetical protein
MINTLEIGLGGYVTHEDHFGGYDTHMVVDLDVDAHTVEVVIHALDGTRTFKLVPFAAILGAGATPTDSAIAKDRELARLGDTTLSLEFCPMHGAECAVWATL